MGNVDLAQALGDLEALRTVGRSVVHVRLAKDDGSTASTLDILD